jgi:hypothetical protein
MVDAVDEKTDQAIRVFYADQASGDEIVVCCIRRLSLIWRVIRSESPEASDLI